MNFDLLVHHAQELHRARHPDTPEAELREMAEKASGLHKNYTLLGYLACNPNLPVDLLYQIHDLQVVWIDQILIHHDRCPTDLLVSYTGHTADHIRQVAWERIENRGLLSLLGLG